MRKIKILLIVPAYNEEKNILSTCNQIIKYNKKNNNKLDYIVINDGSTDDTLKVLVDNNIPHINLIENLGIGGAVQTGYKYAFSHEYDVAIQFDGDGQHDVNYIEELIKPIINKECDMTIGSRFIGKNNKGFKPDFKHMLGINIISKTIKLKTRKTIYDTTSGFRAANRDIIKRFAKNYPQEYPEPISTVDMIKHGYKIKEVGVSMNERREGTSSIHSWKQAYYMFNVVISIIMMGGNYNE